MPKALVIAKLKPLRIWVWDRFGTGGTGLGQVGTGPNSNSLVYGFGTGWDRLGQVLGQVFGTGFGDRSLSTSHTGQPKPKGHHKPS